MYLKKIFIIIVLLHNIFVFVYRG